MPGNGFDVAVLVRFPWQFCLCSGCWRMWEIPVSVLTVSIKPLRTLQVVKHQTLSPRKLNYPIRVSPRRFPLETIFALTSVPRWMILVKWLEFAHWVIQLWQREFIFFFFLKIVSSMNARRLMLSNSKRNCSKTTYVLGSTKGKTHRDAYLSPLGL